MRALGGAAGTPIRGFGLMRHAVFGETDQTLLKTKLETAAEAGCNVIGDQPSTDDRASDE